MNYDWNYVCNIAMCFSWVKQANDWLDSRDKVIINSDKDLPKIIKEYICSPKAKIEFIFNEYVKKPKYNKMREIALTFAGHPVDDMHLSFYEKLFILDNLKDPYIFIDADAFITNDLEPLRLALRSNKPFLFADHESDIKGHTDVYPLFPNSGVFAVNDPKKEFFNIDKIFEYGKSINFKYLFPGTLKCVPGFDQCLLFKYCLHNDYDYHSPHLTSNQNACAIRTEYYKNEDRWSARDKITKKDVTISHHWWRFKPWDEDYKIPCPFFDEILQNLE